MKKISLMLKIFFCSLLFLTTSCVVDHVFLKKDVKPNSRIAVICAEPKYKDISLLFVSAIETELIKSSTFNVVKQTETMKLIPDYPQKIKGPYGMVISSEINENYSKTDVASLREIASKLKVDYLYVIWVPLFLEIDTDTTADLYQCSTIAQLFEFPSGNEIAHAKYNPQWVKDGFAIGGIYSPEEAFQIFSEYIVKDIGKNTKTLK
ncbi:MAG TPA: hypothetical protein PK624_03610 [Spirochaetota bacterium]|nr:hypothetical protein [Spirochaetota bacterium]HOR43866.1 hypothetical protein [Spirochaetota bacterium]HOU83660.1 hypothetical protein [Spirochaetota bacterium]HPK55290.1 hypothetical protein [Spirochaetota bacterium]HQE59147.1 hypothetical protein [Spirochaetota bacterium]